MNDLLSFFFLSYFFYFLCKKYRFTPFIDPFKYPRRHRLYALFPFIGRRPKITQGIQVIIKCVIFIMQMDFEGSKTLLAFFLNLLILSENRSLVHAHNVLSPSLLFTTLISEIWTPTLRILLTFLLTLTNFRNWSPGYEKPSQKLAVFWCIRYPRNYSLRQK